MDKQKRDDAGTCINEWFYVRFKYNFWSPFPIYRKLMAKTVTKIVTSFMAKNRVKFGRGLFKMKNSKRVRFFKRLRNSFYLLFLDSWEFFSTTQLWCSCAVFVEGFLYIYWDLCLTRIACEIENLQDLDETLRLKVFSLNFDDIII